MTGARVASALATIALLVGAVAVWEGAPIVPSRIAAATSEAADNAAEAARNTSDAARDTAALAEIARNVKSQVDTSRRLLEVQLELEDSSRRGADRSEVLGRGVEGIAAGLRSLRDRVAALARLSARSGDVTRSSAAAARRLERTLVALEERFDVLVAQSRKLNKKAHGFDELKDVPP